MKRKTLLHIIIFTHLCCCCAAQQQQADTTYQLPDALVTQSGKKISNKTDWEKFRRPEILQLFEKNVQGKTPAKKSFLHFKTTSVNANALNGTATRKEIRVYFSKDEKHHMDVLFYIPNRRDKPVPLFLGLNFSGNQAIHADTGISLSKRWFAYGKEPAYKNHHATEASRGTDANAWPVEQIIAAGYALGTIYYGDLQPDSANSINAGIAPLFYNKEQTKPAADEWGAIGVWAWGLSRAMDYIETDKDLDAKKTAVIGHSRLGKTALWAGAQDTRFAIVISNNSGEGGAAITRRKYGETIDVMNNVFPHWFSDNFKLYNHKENDLPVDFHELIALIAPRPVYVASASEDQWADPTGEYLSAYHAGAVYALYGLKGLPGSQPPNENMPVGDGSIGYHLRKGGHALTPYDWQQYLRFADRFFKQQQ
ncbi:glucuronyl esterase domain-containing protein [Foetidibacter luteolus]|uniref:glucuronyl esterase domain-containing protein n=1 Tax=Foetidibacter luteolus TaxID=2608880 RepID=UPI00129A4CA5|nr:acetylxylan esterase [Foetidibacter luteolus]